MLYKKGKILLLGGPDKPPSPQIEDQEEDCRLYKNWYTIYKYKKDFSNIIKFSKMWEKKTIRNVNAVYILFCYF